MNIKLYENMLKKLINEMSENIYRGDVPKAETKTFEVVIRKMPMMVRLLMSSALD